MSYPIAQRIAALIAFVGLYAVCGSIPVSAAQSTAEGPYIAAIIRYVRDGEPVSTSGAEQMLATRLIQQNLEKHGAKVIDIIEFTEQFSDLEFDKVMQCVVSGADNPDCREDLEYSNAVVRIMSEVRRRGAEAKLFAKHLQNLEECGGVVLVGEVRANSGGRNAVRIGVDVATADYRTLGSVMSPYANQRSAQFDVATGGRDPVEKKLINNELSVIAETLAKKLAENSHYQSCQG